MAGPDRWEALDGLLRAPEAVSRQMTENVLERIPGARSVRFTRAEGGEVRVRWLGDAEPRWSSRRASRTSSRRRRGTGSGRWRRSSRDSTRRV